MTRLKLRHNGASPDGVQTSSGLVWLRPGDVREIEVDPKQLSLVERKLHLTILERSDGDAKAQAKPVQMTETPKSDPFEPGSREGLIRDIIADLDREADFTKGGKPEVDAINSRLGEGVEHVTAAERDAVWGKMEG